MKIKFNNSQSALYFPAITIALTVVILANPVKAQIVDWTNITNTNSYWHLRANWNTSDIPNATETARFMDNRDYEVWWNATTGDREAGYLSVANGIVTFENLSSFSHELTINGSGGFSTLSDLSISGTSTILINRGLHLHSLGGAQIINGATLLLDGSHAAGARLTADSSSATSGFDVSGTLNVVSGGNVTNGHGYIGRQTSSNGTATISGTTSQWNNSQRLTVGYSGNGTLNIEDGGVVSNSYGHIARNSGATGSAIVTGVGSQWNNSNTLYVGDFGNGTLRIESGGTVNNNYAFVGFGSSTGVVTVTGDGSRWNSSGDLVLGSYGSGTLNVEAGGIVKNSNGTLGFQPDSTGVATVTGSGSQWNNSGNLYVGAAGNGTLNVTNGGTLTVGGTTSIGPQGEVNLSDATSRLEFGQTTLSTFGKINATGGSMAGNMNHTGFTDVNSLTALQNSSVDLTDVTLTNAGVLYGHAALGNALINTATGEVQTTSGQQVRFAGNGNTNAGEINNFGGVVRFEQDMTNQSSGFVSGRGQFIANGGWTNQGVMAFSGGTIDILGDVENQNGGQIVTTGGATTTFYDDVVHNGSEIRTAAGSQSVFFGSVSGASGFTGLGTVFMEGDLRPGNSPGILAFEGDLVLGSGADTIIELGGYLPGDFDQLQVAHNLTLNGDLFVELYDGFQLAFNDEFLIGDVDGSLFGQFNGLSEGDLVGNFGGMDLFITYTAGNGNDVGLFAAVPEPGSFVFFAAGLIGLSLFNRRKNRV